VVWRDRRELPIDVRVGELPQSVGPNAPGGAPERRPAGAAELFGLVLGPVTPDTRPGQAVRHAGVAVTAVAPSSPAEDAGLVAGDLILELDGSAVANPDDAARKLKQAATMRKAILILVDRDGERQFVAVRTGSS
jgi:serine protease Do